MGFPGTTLDKVVQDAQTFAEWKVDMLKLDGCYSTPEEQAKGESHSWLGAMEGAPVSTWLSPSVCMPPRKWCFPVPLTQGLPAP